MSRVDVIFGTEDVQRVLHGYARQASNLDMGDVAGELLLAVDDLFQAQGAVAGQARWDPLLASTIRRNPRRAGRAVLQRTGQMMGFQPIEGALFVEVKSPAEYAGWHVTGTRNMAKRDPTAIDFPKTLERIGVRLLDDLERG